MLKTICRYLVLLLLPTLCASQTYRTHSVMLVDGTQISGTVMDNYPPMYAVLQTGDTAFQLIDYGNLSDESAARLEEIPPLHYGYDAMPEIEGVTYTTWYYDQLDRVTLTDGKIITGIAEHHRSDGYMLLRWPSGEEWYIYYDAIASIEELALPDELPFRIFRHYHKGMAGVFSIAIPGAGHFYNGDYLEGMAFLAGFVAAGTATLMAAIATMDDDNGIIVTTVALGALAIRVWDTVSAGSTASEREEHRAEWQKQRCGKRAKKKDISIGFGLTPLPSGGAAGFTIRF